MIPLLLLALVFAGGFAAYELSPGTHTWVDEHVAALRSAIAAHREADTHMQSAAAAASTGDVAAAQQHVAEADAANKAAAQSTSQAAATAQTPAQRQAAAKSHDQVMARFQQIGAAAANLAGGLLSTAHAALAPFAKLGENGLCGVRTYSGVSVKVRDALLARLHGKGMTVTTVDPWATDTRGGPWNIDTQMGGVTLRAVWDSRGQELKLIVTGPPAASTFCSVIWGRIDPVMKEVIAA